MKQILIRVIVLVMATCTQSMEGVGVSGEGGTRGIPDITGGATGACTHYTQCIIIIHSEHYCTMYTLHTSVHWMVGEGDRRGVTWVLIFAVHRHRDCREMINCHWNLSPSLKIRWYHQPLVFFTFLIMWKLDRWEGSLWISLFLKLVKSLIQLQNLWRLVKPNQI